MLLLESQSVRQLFYTLVRRQSTKSVTLQGWIRKAHRKGAISFVHLAPDAVSDSIQVVVPKKVCNNFPIGSTAKVSGKWVDSIGAKQEKEVMADDFTVLHSSEVMAVKGDLNQLRSKLHLRPKHPALAMIFKLRSKLNFYTHKYFTDNAFCHIDTPLISQNDCEGGGEAFIMNSVDENFFELDKVYLPVSGQLHLEAVCSALPKVYTLNAAFRADKSSTRQHMAEFRMLEVECAFVDTLNEICALVEDYVKFMIMVAKNECMDDIMQLQRILSSSDNYLHTKLIDEFDVQRSFPSVSYNEAVKILESRGLSTVNGFSKRHEQELVNYYEGPVFVKHFPVAQKPFYMRFNENDEAECFDLLFPLIGELAGGSVREYDVGKLSSRHLPTNLDWYLQLRQTGYPRSSGFGLGFDRLIQFLFSIGNVKDTIPFPRWIEMVKVKHRYLLVEVVFGAGGGAKNVCSDLDIYQAVMRKVKVCDANMCIAILRIASDVVDLITSSLPFVLSAGSSDAILRLLGEGSSMRTVEKHLINFNLQALYAHLRRDPNPVEKIALLEAISRVTGSNVADLCLKHTECP